MNSACIIAACAAHSRAMQNNDERMYVRSIDQDLNIYFHVIFRMYVHFNSIDIININENEPLSDFYTGCIIPISTCNLNTIKTIPESIAKEHCFLINSKKCPQGIDRYIADNINEFTDSSIWEIYKDEIIKMYLKRLEEKYNIIIDENYLDYNIQFCYEVESVK